MTGSMPGAGLGRPSGVTTASSDARPATQMGGFAGAPGTLSSRGVAGGRQVMDTTYFLNELRQKNREIAAELDAMAEETRARLAGNAQHDQIERRHDQLASEVRELQGVLQDRNVVLDAVSVGALDESSAELRERTATLRERNVAERARVDAAYGERIAAESSAKDLDAQVSSLQTEVRARVGELPLPKRREYESLEAEASRLADEQRRLEAALEATANECDAAEREVSRDEIKQRALALRDAEAKLAERESNLRDELEKLSLSPEEQRAALKEQIRADNAAIQEAEAEAQRLQREIRKGESKLQGVRVDLGEKEGAGLDRADKYDKLLAQERELVDFIDSFESNRAAAQNDIAARRAAIVASLEKTSRHLSHAENVPDRARFEEMAAELEYKKTQAGHAETTNDRLREERELRIAELAKIDTLDEKIDAELEGLARRSEELESELANFGDAESIRVEAEAIKEQLERDKTSFGARVEALGVVVAEKTRKFEAKRRQVRGNATFAELEKAEVRVRAAEQAAHAAREQFMSQAVDTDDRALLGNIDALCEELNVMAQRRAVYA